MKVLIYIADDSYNKREIIVGMVQEAAQAVFESVQDQPELEIMQFTCGNDVIEAVEKRAPHLVVSDWLMGPGNGLDVVKALCGKEFALWVFSGSDFGSIHVELLEAGEQDSQALNTEILDKLDEKIFYTPNDTHKFILALRTFFTAFVA